MAEASLIKNKYRILHQVGRGGMGNVYEVVHEGLGTTYALKQLHLELENNPEIASRFRHEAQMMARLQHPNIVRVFDIDSEPGFGTYLLMELIKGVDLGKILRTQGRLKYGEVLRTGLAIASALDTAHRAGLVHRDIKPGNILIEEATTRAVVTDFGIAKQMESDGDDNVTRTGSFIGTYRYCSPEQIRNEKGVRIDGRADVYSLGVVLYEMSSGKKFLDGMSEMQIAHHVGFEAHWKPPLEFPEPPSPDFKRLVDQCLAHDREQRPTAAEVIKRLDELLESASEGEHQEAIRELRADVAARSEELQRLQGQLEALDVPAAPSQQSDDLSRQLEAIKQTEDAGQLQDAHASLQSLKDHLSTSRDELARMLRDRLRAMLVDLGTQWDALVARAGEYVRPEQSVQFDGVMQDAERFIASNDWSSCQVKVEEGESFLKQTQASLHEQARLATGAVVEQVGAALDDLRARAGPGAPQAVVNLKAVEEEVGGHIDAGRLNDAKMCAEQALAAVTAALHQSLREQEEGAAHARTKLTDVLAGIDEELARAVAPEQLERASQARSDAAAAEQRRDYAAAAAAYEQARTQYEAAWQEVSRQQAGQLAAVERELRRLLQRATGAPAVIVGDARAAVQTLCDGPRPQKFSEALAAMEQGRVRLAAALDEAERHAEVAARQAAAEAAQQRVRDLGPSRHEVRGTDQLMQQGAAACAERQWTVAAERYAQAVDAFSDLEGRLQARLRTQNETERAAAARAKLEKLLAEVDIEAARVVAGEELARASAAAAQAAEAEQQQEYVEAAARYAEAAGHYQTIKDLVAEQQTVQLAATQQELRVLLQRAADAPAAIVASSCAPAQAALDTPGEQDVALTLEAAERARSGLLAALDEAALYATLAEERAAVERRQQRVAALGLARRQLRPADRLMKSAAAAMKKRQWAVARERYQQADTTLATIEDELRSEPTVVAAPQAGMADAATKMIPASEPFAPATIPSLPTTVWIGSAATAVAVAAVTLWVWGVGPFARPAPVQRAAVRDAEVAPPAAEHPAAGRPAAAGRAVERPAREHPPGGRENPLPLPRIASVVPLADTVAVREGARQSFSVLVDGKPADETLPVEWKLDGKVVAANATQWDYRPSYKAATGASREVNVVIGSGTAEGQAHSWRVMVEDVNRPPVLRSKPHPRIEAPFGKTVALRVTAVDEDDDQLAYRWTVDGKPAGTNAPELKVVASTDHTVSLAVSDGKDTVTSRWQIAAIKPVRLSLDFTPKRLDTLRFDTPQRFALTVPRNAGSRGMQYAWRVDGNQVSDARTFVFKGRDPSIVRSKPVSITATARNAQGQHFSHEWQVRVIPPSPEIVKRSPPGDRLEPGVSERVAFSLQGRAPLGNQRLSYVYEVDGKRVAQGGNSRFTFQPQDDEPHAVTAYIEDNYRQVSRQKIRWTVQASGIVAKVRDWLKEYERAWNAKDARKLGQLRGLDAQLVAHLAESLKDKVGLRVKFTNVAIRKVGRQQAVASYRRQDEWTGAKDGKAVSRTRTVERTFRLRGAQLRESEHGTPGG